MDSFDGLTFPNPADLPRIDTVLERVMRRQRIRLTYLWRHHRLPDLDTPRTFTEKVQARKLACRDPRMPWLTDKLAAKAHVRAMLGPEWIVPTLWHGTQLPVCPDWPLPLVIKARHGCNQNMFLRDQVPDWDAVRARSARWMRRPYGLWLDEWAYRAVPRGIMAEPFVGRNGQLPVDYKIYVFDGHAAFIQVHLARESAHRWMLYDRSRQPVSDGAQREGHLFPASIVAMVEAAETLGRGFDFVRCDFYDTDAGPKFGEFAFYPGSGLDPFDPPSLDMEIGAHWQLPDRL